MLNDDEVVIQQIIPSVEAWPSIRW